MPKKPTPKATAIRHVGLGVGNWELGVVKHHKNSCWKTYNAIRVATHTARTR
jgi:hypothetical protein